MKLSALSLLIGLLLVALASWHNAGGVDLLTNGGFEDGVTGWTQSEGALSTVDDPVHGGAAAARFAGDGQPSSQFIFQWVEVTPGNTYQLSGWVVRNDPNIDHIFFRIDWFDDTVSFVSSVDSTADPIDKAEFQILTTVSVTAPANAHLARVSLRIVASAEFEVFVDDIVFDGPEPTPTPSPILTPSPTPEPTPTPTATPTPTPTPTATSTPTPSPYPSPTPSPTATPTVTHTPTVIPTPTPTPSPSPTPTPSPTASPSTAPTATPTATPTAKPMASPTPTAIQPVSPTQTPTPGAEPDVFPTLVNGGFEQRRDDGTPYGWHKFGGTFSLVQDPVAGGISALKITSETASTKWVYQAISIEGGKHYQLTASALKNDPAVDGVFLRISFYETDDASGSAIESADSTIVIDNDDPSFRSITTGPVRAPDDARSARLRLMLRPVSQLPATAYFDTVSFSSVIAPSPTPTPTGTSVATATPTAPAATHAPTATPSPTPTDDEPSVFTQLTNGSFEEMRADGTPFGWRKVGGEIAVTGERAAHGASALAFHSATGSTKWTYQNIIVEPLAYYEASTFAMPPAPGQAFLRLSWYGTEDGSGPAIGSDDSLGSATGSSFELVRTGSVQAPADARSVKVKLMLRPASAASATAYFDAVTFARTSAPAGNQASGAQSSTSSGSQVNPVDASPSAEAGQTTDPPPAALGAVSTPRVIANVTLAPAAPPAASTLSTNDGPNYDWAIALSIIIPLIGFAFLGAHELQRPKRNREE